MGEVTAISWTDHTFNPWVGCQRVSPGCDHCYAERQVERFTSFAERRRTSIQNWKDPLRWNRKAKRDGVRRRVFCASMADVFDNQVPKEWRDALWDMIASTPQLDWLLLTKRPQNVAEMLPETWGADGWPNVWLGISAENNLELNRRAPVILKVPALVHFLSYEPALGPLDDLDQYFSFYWTAVNCGQEQYVTLEQEQNGVRGSWRGQIINWVIAGGESCPDRRLARSPNIEWFRKARDMCAAAKVPFHFKQWGEWSFAPDIASEVQESLEIDGRYNYPMLLVGKKAAGRTLDGVEHDAFPVITWENTKTVEDL